MYYLAKGIQRVLLILPLRFSCFLARIFGMLLYASKRKRRTAFKNIKMAFPDKSHKEILSIIKKSFNNLGLSLIEILVFTRIADSVEIEGIERVGFDGGIMITIHSGNWEINDFVFAKQRKFAIFVQTQKNSVLGRFLTELRTKQGVCICFSAREIIRCLKDNYTIGVTVDHGAKEGDVAVDFFSHLVPTPRGAVYLAKKFNKKIYPCFAYRRKAFSSLAVIGEPIDVFGRSEEELLIQINKIYQQYLTESPEQYFWLYKRFKRKLDIKILILNDGKPGHLKQSQALVLIAKKNREHLSYKIIDIKYKNNFCRIFADLAALFVKKHSLYSGKWISRLLNQTTSQALSKEFADVIVSAGSFIAPVNKLVSSYLGAKSVVILRPNIPLNQFDLAIIPEHDRLIAPNAVMIKGSVCYPHGLDKKINDCRDFFNLSAGKKITFFVGGPFLNLREFINNLKLFVPKLKRFAAKQGYKVLISTSRRSPQEAEEYLKKEFIGSSCKEALVIASQENHDFVFDGFSCSSDIVFTTSESISMVSEVISLKKTCICVCLENLDDKRRVFFESIQDDVYCLKYPYQMEAICLKKPKIFAKNQEILEQAIGRLL